MAIRRPGEPDPAERRAGPARGRCRARPRPAPARRPGSGRDPAGAGPRAPVRVTTPASGLEQTGRELRQRRLARAVRPLERDDLAPARSRGLTPSRTGSPGPYANETPSSARTVAPGRGAASVLRRLRRAGTRPVLGEPGEAPRRAARRAGSGRSRRTETRSATESARLGALLREHDRRAEALDLGEERARSRRGRAGTSARRAAASRGRTASADARQTRWSSPPESSVRPPPGEVLRADRLRARRPRAARSPPGGVPRFSSPNATSFSHVRHDDLVLGVLEDRRDRAGELGRASVRVSSPPTSTRPEKRPPWKCGTSPASARSSVDFPDPDGPSSATISPSSSRSDTSSSARRSDLRIGEAQVLDARLEPQQPLHDEERRRRRRPAGRATPHAARGAARAPGPAVAPRLHRLGEVRARARATRRRAATSSRAWPDAAHGDAAAAHGLAQAGRVALERRNEPGRQRDCECRARREPERTRRAGRDRREARTRRTRARRRRAAAPEAPRSRSPPRSRRACRAPARSARSTGRRCPRRRGTARRGRRRARRRARRRGRPGGATRRRAGTRRARRAAMTAADATRVGEQRGGSGAQPGAASRERARVSFDHLPVTIERAV